MVPMADATSSVLAPRALGVAALLLAASDALQARLGAVAVRGEITNFTRAASGHCYFSLKDSDGAPALLRCAMFRRAASLLEFNPRDGQQVEVRGRISVYEARGELQCVVEAMLPQGAGSLYELFLRQKARLEAAGLFDVARKRELPSYPRAIGVVSSLGAAALQDVLTALARRAPQVQVIVYPSAVQGAEAPAQLVQAIGLAGRRAEVDTLIVCRGGGSIEDLWAFNDEAVVRSIVACPLPVVCGVGHETDITLADLAADLRAPTPTAAAELAAPVRAELQQALQQLERQARRALQRRLDTAAQSLDLAAARLAHGLRSLQPQQQVLELLAQRVRALLQQRAQESRQALHHGAERWRRALAFDAQRRRAGLAALAGRLGLLDPQRVLARGYAVVQTARGELVVAPTQLWPGEAVTLSLAQGQAEVVLQRVRPIGPLKA